VTHHAAPHARLAADTPAALEIVTLTRSDLYGLLQQAAMRGAKLALAEHAQQVAQQPRLLNRKQLCATLGRSLASLDRDIQAGLPFVRIGAHRRFDLPAVMLWLDQQGGA
jgi:hypothetical protein